jgi:ElaB/YqjD/DUF883 family membrane-anchored ribosome-binding protein
MDAENDVEPPSAEELRAEIHQTSELLRAHYGALRTHFKRHRQALAATLPDSSDIASHPIASCGMAFCLGALVGALRLDRSAFRLIGRASRKIVMRSAKAIEPLEDSLVAALLREGGQKSTDWSKANQVGCGE